METKNKTVRLYDNDAYIKEFESVVLSCSENEKGQFEAVLEATAFFPEEGGQSCDKGTLDGCEVIKVILEGGVIYHILSAPVKVGSAVCGKINFAHRYRNMQHHSGEHIISGLVSKNYGYTNVGFHLGRSDMTMDYDGEFDSEKIEYIEKTANKVIYENIEIIANYPEKAALKNMPYRSKIDIEEDVRIVMIGEYDICACCAPHVKQTGEIGIIKIVDYYRYKGGTRIHALCGYDAVCDYILKHNDLKAVAARLSAKIDKVPESVSRIIEENASLSMKISELTERNAKLIASSIDKTDKIAMIFEEAMPQNEMRTVANLVVEKSRVAAVFSGDDKSGYSFIIASENLKAKMVLDELKNSFAVKGGGSDKMVQGNINAQKAEIEKVLNHIQEV